MKMKSILWGLVGLFGFQSAVFAQKTIIHAGNLLDTETGKTLQNMSIIIEKEEVLSVEKGFVKAGKADKIIDLKNKFVLPGLTDLHVHLQSETQKGGENSSRLNEADMAYKAMEYAKKTLLAGFTTVRDLGGSGVNLSMRDAIKRGEFPGPRIFTAGIALSSTGGHGDDTNGLRRDLMGDPGPKEGVFNGADEASKAVRQRYKEGSDVIKVMGTGGVLSIEKSGDNPQVTEEEFQAIVQTAKDYEMHVAVHAHGKEGMKRAILAGVQSIEHGTNMDEEIMDLMIKNGTYLVPTIIAGKAVAEFAKIEGYFHPLVVPKALDIGPRLQNTFSKAYKRGVKIAFGTDAGVYHHGENAREFGYMVVAGMPAIEAIQSATITAGKILELEGKIGVIKKGSFADIIAVDKDPLKDIHSLEKVSFVMKEGKVYKN